MAGRRELMTMLAQREQELESLKKRMQELNADIVQRDTQIAGYRERESAVVNALTEAELAASNKLKAAGYKCDQLIVEAEETKRDALAKAEETIATAKAEAEQTLSNARTEADNIIANAHEEAKRHTAEAETEYNNTRDKAASLAGMLKSAADDSAGYMKTLNQFVNDLSGKVKAEAGCADIEQKASDDSPNTEPEPQHNVTDDAQAPVAEEIAEAEPPTNDGEDYSDPAEFVKNLYSVEGRVVPADLEPDDEALNAELDAIMGGSNEENRVWTVDEILGTQENGKAAEGTDDELNALIEDVLR